MLSPSLKIPGSNLADVKIFFYKLIQNKNLEMFLALHRHNFVPAALLCIARNVSRLLPQCKSPLSKTTESLQKTWDCHGWSGCNGICPVFIHIWYIWPKNRCTSSSRDRCGFSAEIKIIFGTVWGFCFFVNIWLRDLFKFKFDGIIYSYRQFAIRFKLVWQNYTVHEPKKS